MFKRGSTAVVTLAFALAAMRIGAPSGAGVATASPGGGGAAAASTASDLKAYAPVGGCSAYLRDKPGRPHEAPEDENEGTATKVVDTFFGLDAEQDPPPPAGVRYAIALAPDPRHTNLNLIFDREMSLLVQAAQDEEFDYTSSWLPWREDGNPALNRLGDQQSASELEEGRENCPGVILFRKRLTASSSDSTARGPYDQALVVFVVGEQATGGLNLGQWANAVEWLRSHATPASGGVVAGDGVLRVLGPTFTGSLPSLSRELAKIYLPGGTAGGIAAKFPHARILSGSVSGCSAIHRFRSEISATMTSSVAFGSFQENDSVQIFRFLQYLSEEGTEPEDVTILSEDETAYAASPEMPPAARDPGCDFAYARDNRPIHLVFPRDISALRNAYEKQGVFASPSAGGKDRQHLILQQGEAADESSRAEITDTIPSAGGSVAALDQEAYLYGLVSLLRAHHSRYLVLRCTNPLDFLFLSRFFHRAYPQARVVTVGSDLLFRREIDNTEFRGVLALSSYPLMPNAQHWTNIAERGWEKQAHNHLVFPSHLAEGMYIAARYTVTGAPLAERTGPPLQLNRVFPVPDYSNPFWLGTQQMVANKFASHPPTWLGAIGRDGYWPIAVLDGTQFPGVHLENGSGGAERRCGTAGCSDAAAPEAPESTMVELTPTVAAAGTGTAAPQSGSGGKSDVGAAKNEDPAANGNEVQGKADRQGQAVSPAMRPMGRISLSLPLPWLICSLLALGLVSYELWGVTRGGVNPTDGLLSVFRTSDAPAQSILLGVSCALAVTLLFELAGICFLTPSLAIVNVSSVIFLVVFLAILGAAGVWIGVALFKRNKASGHEVGAEIAYGVSGLFFLGIYWFTFGKDLNQANAAPLFYRMAHLTDGVSPLVPILLLTFGFYLWNWQAMAGNLIVATGCPTLPGLRYEDGLPPPRRFAGLWAGYYRLLEYAVPKTGGGDHLLGPPDARISQALGREVLKLAHPLCFSLRIITIPGCLLVAAIVCFFRPSVLRLHQFRFDNLPLLSLESHGFNLAVNWILMAALLFTATEALRLYSTWVTLRKLLQALGRLRLRRTIDRLRPIAVNSIWSVSGNVRRVQYDLFRQQLDAAKRLLRHPPGSWSGATPQEPVSWVWLFRVSKYGDEFVSGVERSVGDAASWETRVRPPEAEARYIRDVLADATGEVYNKVLVRAWAEEDVSLNVECNVGKPEARDAKESAKVQNDDGGTSKMPLSPYAQVRTAEEFVAYQYIAFIQNIVARMRTMTLSMIFLFIAVCFAISFYPFVPRTETGVWLMLNLALIGAAVAYVYAGMERDEIMSYIANSEPGRLGGEFYLKLAAFLAGPAIGILTTQFPSIADTVLQWLQPGLDAIK